GGRERDERRNRFGVQPPSLLLHPPFESGRTLEVEPVEKRPSRQRHGPLAIAARQRRTKLGEGGCDDTLVERQRRSGRMNEVRSRVGPERVEILSQRMARSLLVRIGPEQRREFLTRRAATAGGRENSEQGKSRRAQAWRRRLVVGFESEATESH